jgi:hypothetical protein
MDIIHKLPNDLKDTIKDIVIDYRNKQKFIRDNIKKHSFGIEKTFYRKTRCSFSLTIYLHIKDNYIYGNCYTNWGSYWKEEEKHIECIPIMPFTQNKQELKKLARIIKNILHEYIIYTYHHEKTNFKESTKCEYKFVYTDWKQSIINNKICNIEKKQNKLKTKDVYKGLCELWLPNLDFMGSINILKEQDVYIRENTQFELRDHVHDLGSYYIYEPFKYSDLIMMQKEFPIIYSLLEKNDKLYSIYIKLPDDIIELERMKERFEYVDYKYYEEHIDTIQYISPYKEILYDENYIEDKDTFNSKVEMIFYKYWISDEYWRYNYESGYIKIPDMRIFRESLYE